MNNKLTAPKVFCWNCEEEVHSESFQCPYCGVNLGGSNAFGSSDALPPPYQPSHDSSPHSHFTSEIPTPIYQDTQVEPVKQQQDRQSHIQRPNLQMQKKKGGQPFKKVAPQKNEQIPPPLPNDPAPSATMIPPTPSAGMETAFKTLLLLLAGMVFFMFGLILFLYSGQPFFTLRWDTSNWIYFLPPSLPMLYFGWKSVQEME